MNYAEEFGTDWEDLDRDEALLRAYALGVAERLGGGDEEELARVQDAAGSTYDRELVELAFEEGRARAGEARASAEGSVDDEEVWARVRPDRESGDAPTAGDEGRTADEPESNPPGPAGAARDRTDLPSAVTENDLQEGAPDRLDLPPFLRR